MTPDTFIAIGAAGLDGEAGGPWQEWLHAEDALIGCSGVIICAAEPASY